MTILCGAYHVMEWTFLLRDSRDLARETLVKNAIVDLLSEPQIKILILLSMFSESAKLVSGVSTLSKSNCVLQIQLPTLSLWTKRERGEVLCIIFWFSVSFIRNYHAPLFCLPLLIARQQIDDSELLFYSVFTDLCVYGERKKKQVNHFGLLHCSCDAEHHTWWAEDKSHTLRTPGRKHLLLFPVLCDGLLPGSTGSSMQALWLPTRLWPMFSRMSALPGASSSLSSAWWLPLSSSCVAAASTSTPQQEVSRENLVCLCIFPFEASVCAVCDPFSWNGGWVPRLHSSQQPKVVAVDNRYLAYFSNWA